MRTHIPMNEEMRRAMQPHLGNAEKLTDVELHAQLPDLDPKSMQGRVYTYELRRRRLVKSERWHRHIRIWIWSLLALLIAALPFVATWLLEKGRHRHIRHNQPASRMRDH